MTQNRTFRYRLDPTCGQRAALATLLRPDSEGGFAPNGASAKTGLNRSIQDAGWGLLLQMIAYKAEEAGRDVVAVNPAYTSQRCAQCGHVDVANRVTQAEFRCTSCGHEAHADINAAKNVLRAGRARQRALL